MVKELSLGTSLEDLEKKSENVTIDEKSDEKTILRYIKSTNAVFTKAESSYRQGNEEEAYIYFLKYFDVYSQLRSCNVYLNKKKVVLDEFSRVLPIANCKKALDRAEQLKKSLTKRYAEREEKLESVKRIKEAKQRVEEEKQKELLELEKLKIEAAQPAVDASTLFYTSKSSLLVPIGQSPKDLIPKEPFISAIELNNIINAGVEVLFIDIRTLEEFKLSHMMFTSVIFVCRAYLDITTKLTSNDMRELIIIKEHKTLWDKRCDYDLIVIFDTDSQYSSVADKITHPINTVRDCSTNCLDPNFFNSDLPKILDGGYGSWVYHFPKNCTNPDKAKKFQTAPHKVRRSAPASLKPLSTPKTSTIYPELNKDTDPKPVPSLIPVPETSPSVVTCGNVQINIPPSPQTIQINQWGQDQPPPPLFTPTTFVSPRPAGKPRGDGSLEITDVYDMEHQPSNPPNGPSVSSHGLRSQDNGVIPVSKSQPYMVKEDDVTIFPPKPTKEKPPPEPLYAQVELKRKVPATPQTPVGAVKPNTVEYADIRAIRGPPKPAVDRSNKPRESPTPIQSVLPQVPSQPVSPVVSPVIPPVVSPVVSPTPAKTLPSPPQLKPREVRQQPSPPEPNPIVNRVVKPLSAKAIEEKYMRMMPAYGSVQCGTCGLKNIGNTCFMNAVLQCLSAIAPLTKYFISGRYKHEINPTNPLGTKGLVTEEYVFLVKAMWSDRYRHLAPKDWKNAIGRFRPQFLDYSQKDSQEFTSFMLDALHEDLNRGATGDRKRQPEIDFTKMSYKEGSIAAWKSYTSRNNSVIVDLFQGQFMNITKCLKCGYESVTFDTFMYLTVPVGKSRTTLQACIDTFCQQERIEWRCDRCKVMGNATKEITIWRLPTILVVILKRFSYTGMWRDKISTFVDFPVKNFRAVGREVDWISNPEEGKVYRLFGVANHTGTLEGGHYIGCARNALSGDWFTYDDHVIRPMKAEQTRKKEAYLLFYTSLGEQDDIDCLRLRS